MIAQFAYLLAGRAGNILIGWLNLRFWRRRFQPGAITEKPIQLFLCIAEHRSYTIEIWAKASTVSDEILEGVDISLF